MPAALQEHIPEEFFVKRDVHGLSEPGGQVHRVGQGQAADAFPAVGDQGLATEDMGGESVQLTGLYWAASDGSWRKGSIEGLRGEAEKLGITLAQTLRDGREA